MFGAPASGGGLFGAAPAASGGGLFGAAPAASSGGGLFGAAPAAAGGGLFGAAPAAAGGGLFGATPAASSGGGLFGAAPAAAGGGLFGGAAASGGGGLFGAAAAGGGMGMAAGGGMMGQVNQQDAQRQCMELMQRMQVMQAHVQQHFIAYTYAYSQDPQVLMQYQTPQAAAMAPAPEKYAEAVQNNPDPRSCYPFPIIGLPALEQRIGVQQKGLQDQATVIDELKKGYDNLKDNLQGKSLQKLEECRQRHQMLSRQLLTVVAALEVYAIQNGAARQNPHLEAKLEDQFARLEDELRAPASARARLEELWVVQRGLLQRGAPPGGAAGLSEIEAQKTLQITEMQGELLESLQEEVARRKQNIDQFETVLSAPAPTVPQGF